MFVADDERFALAKTAKGARARAALLNAGVDLVFTEGLGAVSVRAVCKRAGQSRTSFYNYFLDLESFLAQIESHVSDEMASQIHRSVDRLDRGIPRLSACLNALFTKAASEPRWGALLVQLANRGDGALTRIAAEVRAELTAAAEAGEIRLHEQGMEIQVHLLASSTLTLIERFARRDLDVSVVDHAVTCCLWGLADSPASDEGTS